MSISFNDFQTIHGTTIPGRARKYQSDMIMDATFTEDIQYQVGYFFDYYHCSEENRLKLEGFDPTEDLGPTPIDVKFIAHSKKTFEKDEVTMHIQFRPGHQCSVEYYDEVFGKRYNARYPVGLYVWLKGEDDIYRRWLVVATADRDENQFPTWEVLRCDDVFRWIKNGKYYEFPGVSRSQNSYNSGLWTDYRFTQPEDQTKFALPLNRDTELLFYNTYLVIDAMVKENPRVWQISKVNRSNSKGIAIFTCTQELENQHITKAEYDEYGNVTKWWADWGASEIQPVEALNNNPQPTPSSVTAKVTCSGKPQLKVGGSTKTLTVRFYNEEGEEVEGYSVAGWAYTMDGLPLSNNYISITPVDGTVNKYKCKFLGDDTFVGKVITVQAESGDITATLDIEVLPL